MSRLELSMGSNIVVISLHGDIARIERMSKLLDKKGVQFKFFDDLVCQLQNFAKRQAKHFNRYL